jgi:hypothetical protein
MCVYRQVGLDGDLCCSKVDHRMPLADGEVRDDVAELPLERRKAGEGLVDAPSQGDEGSGVVRG